MKIPIEIISLESEIEKIVENAISVLNAKQNAFHFIALDKPGIMEDYSGYRELYTPDIYPIMNKLRTEIKGWHPHILAVTTTYLENDELSNLFGDLERLGDFPTGNGIITTYQVVDIIKKIPLEVYFMYQFLAGSIQFLTRKKPYHDEVRYCIFDKKFNKGALYETLKYSTLCLDCKNLIRQYVNNLQLKSIRGILHLIGDVCCSENPTSDLKEMISQSRAGKTDFADTIYEIERIRELIRKDEISGAIEDLSRLIKESNPSRYNELIILDSRLRHIQKQSRLNTLQRELINIELNKIRHDVLALIAELEN